MALPASIFNASERAPKTSVGSESQWDGRMSKLSFEHFPRWIIPRPRGLERARRLAAAVEEFATNRSAEGTTGP